MKGFKCIVGICEGCFLKNKVCFQKGPKGFCGIKDTRDVFRNYRKRCNNENKGIEKQVI